MSKLLIQNQLSETELLLSCARVQIPSTLTERIQSLVQKEIDWTFVLSMAEKHRIMPLLYHSLKTISPQTIPKDIQSTLKMRFYKNAQTNLILTDELFHLLDIFSTQNLTVIPYKGTVLGAVIYGKTAFRQVWDIDLLVDEIEFEKSRSLLLSEGYLIKESFDREQSFFHPIKKIEVDLHWGLTPFYFPVQLDFKKLWSRTQVYSLVGGEVKSFCGEDLLIILCLQVAKDCWERRQHLEQLAKVCDISELLKHYTDLNWSDVIDTAKEKGLQRILNFGLFLSKSLLDAPVPEPIWSEVIQDKIAISLAYQVSSQLCGEIDRTVATPYDNALFDWKFRVKQLIFYLKIRERRQDWFNHFLEIGRNGISLLKEGRRGG